MINPLQTDQEYELFIYTLAERFSSIRHSTLTFVRRGGGLARVAGELHFAHTFRIVVRERLVYQHVPVVIDWYGYEVWQGDAKLYWYDPQPHPHEPTLQSSYPHHKHVPPDIKHNRIPALGMSFTEPNLPKLIQEVEELIQRLHNSTAQS